MPLPKRDAAACRPTIPDLLARAERTPDGCLIWKGPVSRGYPAVSWGARDEQRHARVHRLVLADALAKDEAEIEVAMHICDVRRCIEPTHLRAGTFAENSADMVAKGRQQRGTGHAHSSLTPEQVREIRSLQGRETQVVTAARFGIGQASVCRIQTRTTYAEVI